VLLEHHVDQQIVVHKPLVRRAELLEQAMTAPNLAHHVVVLGDHPQRFVAANGDALGTTLALARVDHDRELAPLA
jgi:hypothetical protein